MKIHEYQAKQLLKQYGVPVPQGQVASNPDEVREVAKTLGKRVVIKGQVHSGGRGKAGAVKLGRRCQRGRSHWERPDRQDVVLRAGELRSQDQPAAGRGGGGH